MPINEAREAALVEAMAKAMYQGSGHPRDFGSWDCGVVQDEIEGGPSLASIYRKAARDCLPIVEAEIATALRSHEADKSAAVAEAVERCAALADQWDITGKTGDYIRRHAIRAHAKEQTNEN